MAHWLKLSLKSQLKLLMSLHGVKVNCAESKVIKTFYLFYTVSQTKSNDLIQIMCSTRDDVLQTSFNHTGDAGRCIWWRYEPSLRSILFRLRSSPCEVSISCICSHVLYFLMIVTFLVDFCSLKFVYS